MKKLILALLSGIVSISILSACAQDSYLGGEEEEDAEDKEAITTTVPADDETTSPGTTNAPQTEETPSPLPDLHNHTAGDLWMVDVDNHWHVCSCGEIMDLSAHSDPEDCEDCNTSITRWDDGMVELSQYNDQFHCIFEAEYDENGNLLAKSTYAYTYTASNQIETSKTTVYNGNGEITSTTDVTCTYDANGNLLTEIDVYNNLEDDYSYTTQYTYTYTELNNVLTQTTEEYDEDGNLTSTYQIEYTYNELGMPTTEKHYSDGVLTTMYFLEADEDGFPSMVKSYDYYSDGTIFVTEYEDYEVVNEYWMDADGNMIDRSDKFDQDAAADLIGTWTGTLDMAELLGATNGETSLRTPVSITFCNDGTYVTTIDISFDALKQLIMTLAEAMLRSMYTDEEFLTETGMTIADYVAATCDDDYVRESYDEMATNNEAVYYVENGVLYTAASWDDIMESIDYSINGNVLTIDYEGISVDLTKN